MATPSSSQNVVDRWLRDAHRRSSRQPIRGADSSGVFPSLVSVDVLGLRDAVPPIVVDTNRLCTDIAYASRQATRTTLVNAANTGALRVLCAEHVASEIVEHASRFASELGVEVEVFSKVWTESYVPLLRVVRDVPSSALTSNEERRVLALAERDGDDVPTARLAIATGAVLLSGDQTLLEAAYGAREAGVGKPWVSALKRGGDVHEASSVVGGAGMLVSMMGAAVSAAIRSRAGAFAAGAALAAAIAAYRQTPSERRARAGQRAADLTGLVAELVARCQRLVTDLVDASIPPASGEDLAEMDASNQLLRACIRTLARSSDSHMSARDLAHQLPRLGVPSGESKVRGVLRGHVSFEEVYRGRFQLGAPSDYQRGPVNTIAVGTVRT